MATAAGVRPLDQAIRTIPAAWFRPDRRLYWADMLGSAAVGWTALALSPTAGPWLRSALIIVAVFALYRAGLFIHEISLAVRFGVLAPLPYHNLGRAHRLLVSTLASDSPYAATQHEAMAPLVRDLVRRSWTRHRG